ncbi:peptide ABC transporter substrate-binding protein [bacterium]|nr:MAG: peptide ABC transporter substrate-binding protein [bacterium]
MSKKVCWPTLCQWKKTFSVLTKKEKIVFAVFVSLIISSLFYIIFIKPSSSDIQTPAEGGVYTEGMIGQPRYINPILSDNSKIDTDISSLIFSGLLKYDENGSIVCDAAESFTISDDKKTYTITMRDGMLWHGNDNQSFDTEDLEFTFKLITDSTYNSPLYDNFRSVELFIDDNLTARFVLKQPYAPFLQNLTFKILPKHIWESVSVNGFTLASANLRPIGSGPFQIDNLKKNNDGLVRSILLKKFDDFYGDDSFIKNIEFYFYNNKEELLGAYQKKEILGISQLPDDYQEYLPDLSNTNLHKIYLPQFFSVFINQKNNKILEDTGIRATLATSIDRNMIIQEALNNTALPVDKIIPPLSISNNDATPDPVHPYDKELAIDALEQMGWIDSDADGIRDKEELKLEFTLTTSDQDWIIKVAEEIKKQWETIGVNIIINTDLQNDTIKNRDYELLLFGQSPIASSDPCAFWHSSQQEYPGINLSLFSNSTADTILENIRTTFDETDKLKLFTEFQEILTAEIPSIPLLQPFEIFATNQKIGGINIVADRYPLSRFSNINKWYIQIKYAKRNKDAPSTN